MASVAYSLTGRGHSRRRLAQGGLAAGLTAGCALALAACGLSEPPGNSAAGTGPHAITWSTYGGEAQRLVYQAAQDRFVAQQGGKYTATLNLLASGEYIEKTLASLAADTPADVFLTYAQYKSAWAKKNLLLDVSDRWKKSKTIALKMYYPPVAEAVAYKSKQYGTPWGYNATMMVLVTDRFNEKNVPLPDKSWTMQEYAALAKRLTDPEKKIFGTANGANVDGQSMFSLMWNYGKHYWVNDDETKSLVNSEASVEMFRFFQDLQFRDQSAAWTGNPLQSGFGFTQGAIAMSIQYSSSAAFSLAQAFKDGGYSFDWRLHTFPKGPKDQQHFSQGHLWTIAKGHKAPDVAWPMAEFLGSMEAEKVWAEKGHVPPQVPSNELWEQYYGVWPAETRKAAIDFIQNTVYKGRAVNFQYWPTFYECQPIMTAARNDMFGAKQVPAKVALDDAARQMDEVLRANR